MSNSSIKTRIQADLRRLAEDPSFCVPFSEALNANLNALEMLSSEMLRQGQSLSLNALHCGWVFEEDCDPNISSLIQSIQEWLRAVPE